MNNLIRPEMKYLRITLVLLVFIASCEKFEDYRCENKANYQETELVPQGKADKIAEIICNTLNSNELIGVQVSIRDSLNEDWNISMGAIDLKQYEPIMDHHLLRIGSVTKIFTSTLILKLIEQNELQLDQEISDFYPEIDNIKNITIENLLNHSSGIKDVFSIPAIMISSTQFPDKQWDPSQLAAACMDKKLDFPPGSKHGYSNTNYILLGLIAEKATGEKIEELFIKHLFEPLNLENTFLVPNMKTPEELVNGYVHHYALSLKEWFINEPANTSWSSVGFSAGSIVSNSNDLSAFTYHLFNEDIISQESLELMTNFSGNNGLGLFKMNVNGHTYWGHEGEITGFESITAYDPADEKVISICCNTTPFNVYDLLNEIDAEL
jgi:D-alanyl-D-alanine carboxypeptidase